jgi:sugar lactone lactonase YvrE
MAMSSPLSIAIPSDDLEPILLRADPSCLAFDQRTDALYVADAYSGAIIEVDHRVGRQRRIATIDSGGVIATNRIGGLALAEDGALYVSRVGCGQAGAVFRVVPGHEPEPLAAIHPRPWRGGLATTHGTLYTTQFMRSSSGPFDGALVAIDLATGACSTLLDGFLFPTGVVALGANLVVADARHRAVFLVELAGGLAVSRLQLAADLDRPDAIAPCGEDSVLVTSYDEARSRGTVRRIYLDGHTPTRVIAEGAWEPRGVATDGERVFVATRRTGAVLAFHLYF